MSSSSLSRIIKILLAAFLLLPLTAQGQSAEYERNARKAETSFAAREWLNASAMYTLMLHENPRQPDVYAHAIVAQCMAADTARAVTMIQEAMNYAVPLDTLLSDVRGVSLSTGSPDMYEQLLLKARDTYPYLARAFNIRLADYYQFRTNGPMMVEYARRLLTTTPGNVRYRRLLAEGYMLQGDDTAAAREWSGILADHPDDLPTLLDFGSLYWTTGRRADALPLLTRAYSIAPTPYLEHLITRYHEK